MRSPTSGAAGKGKHVGNLVALQPGETVRAILPVRDLEEENKYVFFVTRQGTVKKTPLKDFCNVMSRGIIAIGIDKEDELVGAQITDGNQILFLASHEGMAIRFHEDDVRSMGRPAFGVRGMDLDKGDYIVGMAVTAKEKPTRKQAENGGAVADRILSVTENAYGKRTDVDEYRLQSRGGKGVINVKTTSRNGKVVVDHAGDRGQRSDDHQPVRQDHPHGDRTDPRRWPLNPGRAPAASGRGRSRRGGRRDSGRRSEWKWGYSDADSVRKWWGRQLCLPYACAGRTFLSALFLYNLRVKSCASNAAFDWIEQGRIQLSPRSEGRPWSCRVHHLVAPQFARYVKILHSLEAHFEDIDHPLTEREIAIFRDS